MSETAIIAELKRRQGRLSQSEYAEVLGIRQASLSRIYNGTRRITPVFAKHLRALYPSMAFSLASYLLDEADGDKAL